MIVNVGHPEGDDRLERVLTATMRAAFGRCFAIPSQPVDTFAARDGRPASGGRLAAAAPALPAPLRPVAGAAAARLRPGLPGGRVYTDDRAPVEWLVDASLLEVAAKG